MIFRIFIILILLFNIFIVIATVKVSDLIVNKLLKFNLLYISIPDTKRPGW